MIDARVKEGDGVVSGIKTEAMLSPEREYTRQGFRVTWIEWDSDFRRSGLQIEDLIVEVDGSALEDVLQPGRMGTAIGQPNESLHWENVGAKPGQTVLLKVMRGSQTLEIAAKLRPHYFYYDGKGRPSLGPGGPPRRAHDEQFTEWAIWYERLVWKMSYILDGAWDWRSMNNKRELQEHDAHKERLAYLVKMYPGPFTDAAVSDWERVMELLRGRLADRVDLEYREVGAKRAQTIKQQAGRAWTEFLKAHEQEMIPAFPAADVGKHDSVVGKMIELPWITFRDIVSDLGRPYAVAGSHSGHYIVPLSNPEAHSLYAAMQRYKNQVNPKLAERYQYVGRILDEPRMITFQGRAITGLSVQLVAGRAGQEEFFADLTKRDAEGKAEFAGEDTLSLLNTMPPSDDAPPEKVIEAMISAVKFADEGLWESLFASWRVMVLENGHAIYDPSHLPSHSALQSAWEHSRKHITSEIYDARINRVGFERQVLSRNDEKNLPEVDEVYVFVDHYGMVENEYRVFVDMTVNRRWKLQRLNKGSWKIVDVAHL